jgi:hypothetical protein
MNRRGIWEYITIRGEMGSRCNRAHGHKGGHTFVGTLVQPWSRVTVECHHGRRCAAKVHIL